MVRSPIKLDGRSKDVEGSGMVGEVIKKENGCRGCLSYRHEILMLKHAKIDLE